MNPEDELYSVDPADEGAMSVDPAAGQAPPPAVVPPQYSAGRMPRMPMPLNHRMARAQAAAAPRGAIDAGATVGMNAAPPAEEAPGAGPVPMPGAFDPKAAVQGGLALEAELQAAAGPARYLGPPTTQTSKTSAQSRVLSQEQEGQIASLSKQAADASSAADQAAQRQAELQSAAMSKQAEALGMAEQAQAEARARMQERTAQMRAQSEAIRAAAERDDGDAEALRERYATRDTLRRVVGAIGMYFAGYGAGMQGRDPTGAMQFVQANIDAQWDRDMKDLQHARGKGDKKRSYAAQLLEETGNEEAAYHRFRAESMDVFESQAKKIALASGSQETIAKHEELSARMDAERAASMARSIEEEAPLQQVEQVSKVRTGGVVGGVNPNVRKYAEKERERAEANQDFAYRESIKAKAAGGGDPAEKEAAAVRGRVTALESADAGLVSALSEATKGSGLVFDESGTATKGRAATAADMLREAGLDEAAKSMASAKSPAEQAAIMQAALPEIRRRKAAALSSATPAARQLVKTPKPVSVKEY